MPPRRKLLNEDAVPALIVDILETEYGRWMTEVEIIEQVLLHRPDVKRGTVHRAVQRLTHRDAVATSKSYDVTLEVVRDTDDHNMARTRVRVAERAYWHEATG